MASLRNSSLALFITPFFCACADRERDFEFKQFDLAPMYSKVGFESPVVMTLRGV